MTETKSQDCKCGHNQMRHNQYIDGNNFGCVDCDCKSLNMNSKTIKKEPCGCEFTTIVRGDNGYSCVNSITLLTKCRCEKHYDEQLVAEWTDHEGHHRVIREPEEVDGLLPLEQGAN